MNKFFVDELLERLETLSDTVNVTDQTSLKSTIILYGCQDRFPMVCNEYTPDSNFDVDIDESKFLKKRKMMTAMMRTTEVQKRFPYQSRQTKRLKKHRQRKRRVRQSRKSALQ